jgi:mannose-6-phosphate isomerase-like protein (cupin superfamily)
MTPSISDRDDIGRAIRDVAADPADARGAAVVREAGLDALPALAAHLTADAPIEILERYESMLKSVLLDGLRAGVPGPTARLVARFQQRVGFLCKVKSYAIKCATPLGYSVFFQRPGEGFSFQRHVTRKTEVFHILDVHPGGYAYICSHEDWTRTYDPVRFAAWLAGNRDTDYDRFRFSVRPGDLFVIDELNVVHTVVGCDLAEFATVSTDMVDRLHDQNAGRTIPGEFDRAYARRRLEEVRFPPGARRLTLGGAEPLATPVEPEPIHGGRLLRLEDSFVVASRYLLDEGGTTEVLHDTDRASVLHVATGRGRVVMGDEDELSRPDPPAIAVGKADVVLVPPGTRYALAAAPGERLEVAEHRITLEAALA